MKVGNYEKVASKNKETNEVENRNQKTSKKTWESLDPEWNEFKVSEANEFCMTRTIL